MEDRTVERLRFATAWLTAEREAGVAHGERLLALPTALWRTEMNRDGDLRRYGTLEYLLGKIHDDISHYPLRARERAAVIVEYVDCVHVAVPQYAVGLAGLAWKEYANALKYVGEFAAAIEAASKSQELYLQVPSFTCDAARARLVEALAHRELGNLDVALRIARECAAVFLDFGAAEAYVHARMTEALALSDAHRHVESMKVLREAAADAEARGDRHTLAMCLHNSAVCARAIGDIATARDLDARALTHFEELGTRVEIPRIRWTEAMILAEEGRISAAIAELYRARAELVSLGMTADAALYGLDIIALRFQRGDDVTTSCAELVETFTTLGMLQSAVEALAYLREQSRTGSLSPAKIRRVREFIGEAGRGGARLFLPPPDEAEDRA